MQIVVRAARRSVMFLVALVLCSSYPLGIVAATDGPLATETATTATSEPATETPVGGDSPVPKETYTYNTETGHWDSNRWQFNPESGAYERPPQTTLSSPIEPEVSSPTVVDPALTSQAGDAQVQSEADKTIDVGTSNSITNAINSGALSGDATVSDNTTAGSATSGDASASATIINNVNSSVSNSSNQKAATFVSDVVGDVSGDIILQPMLLKAMLEAGANTSSDEVTVTNNSQLTNDINLNATSGDATVSGNTSAGSATTGDANTVANVLNIVNSMVAANRSFVGTINIYGSLDGDILIAPDFIPQMLASNGDDKADGGSVQVSSTDTQSIVNNIALAAETGQAAVTGNTNAGSATTGDANTNVVLFNLSGHEIIASNSLLVFVNVLGKWVGVIVDAPTGATAAAIGNGVTTNTSSPDLVIDMTTNTSITNNITLSSLSGNATVSGNTRAGDAASGSATASANIGNIVGTQMGLSDWFGVLFINVFGNWNGSFGIDTTAGGNLNRKDSDAATESAPRRVIDFVPRGTTKTYRKPAAMTLISSSGSGGYQAIPQPTAKTISASHDEPAPEMPAVLATSDNNTSSGSQLPWMSGVIFLSGLSLVGTSMLSDARRRSINLEKR